MSNSTNAAIVAIEFTMKTFLNRKTPSLLLASVVGALLGALPAPAAESNEAPAVASSAPTGLNESAFSIISERNIFNSKRTGSVLGRTQSRRTVEDFALTGTMDYGKGKYAVFEGSSTEFTKVLQPNGFIAGYKVVEIQPNSVKLELTGQITELPIGTGMRREDRGPWKFTEVVTLPGSSPMVASSARDFGWDNGRNMGNTDFRSNRNTRRSDNGDSFRGRDVGSFNSFTSSRTTTTTTPTPPTALDPAEQAETLKRLMERRAKEDQ
jgi:hypothetical protein